MLVLSGMSSGGAVGSTQRRRTARWPVSGIFAANAIYGKYVKGQGEQQFINSAILTNSNVDGIALHVAWSATETSDGVYVWNALDSLTSQAASAGKTVTLDVIPGWETPAWIYTEGAQRFNFIWADSGWGPTFCSVATIPAPWDAVYLAKWSAFVKAMGARYDSNPTVVGVKLLGVNSDDEETRLPYSVNARISNGKTSCVSYDDVTDWQAIGYTRLVVESAWEQIAAVYQVAFPDKALIAVLNVGGFPPIDDYGNIFVGSYGQDSQVSTDVIAAAVADYGVQFALQNDGLLSYGAPWATEVSYANQITTGYQTVAALGARLPAALNSATGVGAEYLELYTSDLTDASLQSAIAAARSALQ